MTKTPTQAQYDDAAFLTRTRWACLFSEPGTGKTLTAITARKALEPALRTLVICPKIALRQWQREMAEQGIEATIYKRGQDFGSLGDHTVVITTWALMTRNRQKLEAWHPIVIIADESHACIDYRSQRTTEFFGKNGDGQGLATIAAFCWLLTGTPVIRFADDLWPMLVSMFPDALRRLVGSKRRQTFLNRYVRMRQQRIPGGRTVTVPYAGQNEQELFDMIYQTRIAVRRTLAETDRDLPELRERDITVDLKGFDEKMLKGLSDADLLKNTPEVKSIRRAFGIAKLAETIEYVTEVAEPALVLTWHQDVTDALGEALGARCGIIDGRTSPAQREEVLRMFDEGKLQFVIGQIGAVGTALDGLQHRCRRVIFAERIGSPALMDQAIARVQRRGQRQPVQVDYLRADHRLEYVTDAALAAKEATQRKTVG